MTVSHRTTKRINIRLSALAVVSAIGVAPLAVEAAGLGRVTVFSALGQPLRAEIEVSATKAELHNMTARLATPAAFKSAGLDYPTILSSVKFSVDTRPDGQSVIRLTSDRPVSDPFIDMLVELNWSAGRLMREYTFLLDPPEMASDLPAPAPVAAPVVAVKPTVSPVAVVPAPVEDVTPVPAAAESTGTPVEMVAEEAPVEEMVPEEVVEPEVVAEPEVREVAPVARRVDERTPERQPMQAGEQRAVKYGDYLNKIAREVAPEGVTLDQVLVGLFRANPDAFQGENMNRLMAGKILVIPSAEEIASVAADDARRDVIAQAVDWNAYRRRLAALAAKGQPVASDERKESVGRITAKVEDKVPAAKASTDKVKVSKTETQLAALKKQSEEDKIAREKALKESAERAAQLEKSVADLQKLNQMKAQSEAEQKSTAPADEKPSAADKSAESVAIPVRPKAIPEPPPLEDEEGDLLTNPLVLGGGLAVAGLAGFLVYRRRRAAMSDEDMTADSSASLLEPSLGANSVFRATGGQSVDTSNATPAVTDFSQTGPGSIDTDEVDPVAEAEVYMAYGRDAQAEEILLEALKKDSSRFAIHLKLLEIYALRKSAKQFETLASELYSQTGGNGIEWEKAVAMGMKFDPTNPLFQRSDASVQTAAPSQSPFDPGATMVTSPQVDAVKSTVVNPGAFAQMAEQATASVDVDHNLGIEADAMSPLDLGAPMAADDKLTFDFDIGEAQPAADLSSTAAFMSEDVAVSEPDPVVPAEFDAPETAAFDIPAALDISDASSGISDAIPDVPEAAGEDLNVDISFDLPSESESVPVPDSPQSDGNILDFDLGFGTASVVNPSAENLVDLGADAEVEQEVDVKLTDSAYASPEANKPDLSSISLDLGDVKEMDFDKTTVVKAGLAAEPAAEVLDQGDAADSQEVATKLDLAKAYEEMGDAEGARELLREVLAEGSPGQRDAANAILARLG